MYVVLTLVPRLHRRPGPGESLATGIREEGCSRCDVDYTGKLKPCWKHTHDHILWAEKVDDAEAISDGSTVSVERDPLVRTTEGTEELLEVPV